MDQRIHRLRCLGRFDDQVKVRGYRIELDEIQKNLIAIPEINNAVVLVKKVGNNQFLCAYLTIHSIISDKKIKELLGEVLPSYMIPAYIFILKELPINSSGKIDRKKLLQIQLSLFYPHPVDRNFPWARWVSSEVEKLP